MIEQPDTRGAVWNPLTSYQLGVTSHSGESCVMVNLQGETGEAVTVIFENLDELQGFVDLVDDAAQMLSTAVDLGFEEAVALHGDGLPSEVPDDLSSLLDVPAAED